MAGSTNRVPVRPGTGAISDPDDSFPYYIEGDYLMKKPDQPDESPKVIGRRVEIIGIRRNIDNGRVTVVISFYYKGENRTTEMPRGKLTRSKVVELLDLGADVADHKVSEVLIFLNHQEEKAPMINVHTRIGWDRYEGTLVFKAAQAIGCESTYSGSLGIQAAGTYEGWAATVSSEVLGHTPLELALVIGLTAPVVSLLAMLEVISFGVIVVHVFGNSTMGKTTATMLAVSPFGYPNTSGNGLIKTWYSTQNAIIGHFRENFGIAMGLDEASSFSGNDFSQLVYQLAGGQDKSRMDKEGNQRGSSGWSTTIISNAEHSLTGKTKQNIGIRMRLLELGNMTWTKSAENADAIREGLLKNYGHAGPAFVRHLMELGPEALVDRWNQWREKCFQLIEKKDHFSHRIADKQAVIMATADLASEALQLNLNLEAIHRLIIDIDNNSAESRDIGQNAYEYLLESFERHKKKFSKETDKKLFPPEGHEVWGKYVVEREDIVEICILPKVFKELMTEGGFEDTEVVLKEWKNKGLLDHDKEKTMRKRNIQQGGGRLYVHCIRIRREPPADDSGEPGGLQEKTRTRPAPGAKTLQEEPDLFEE